MAAHFQTGLSASEMATQGIDKQVAATAACPVHGKNHKVFLSYRRSDGDDFAARVSDFLAPLGIDAFLDVNCLAEGAFASNLHDFGDSARVFVPVLTPDYVARRADESQRDFCRFEVQRAIGRNQAIIPVMKQVHLQRCTEIVQQLPEDDPMRQLLTFNICFVNAVSFANDTEKLSLWITRATSALTADTADDRTFVNTFPDFGSPAAGKLTDLVSEVHHSLQTIIPKTIQKLLPHVGAVAECSNPKRSRPDFSLYTGVAGQALALHSACEYFSQDLNDDMQARCKAAAEQALDTALQLIGQDPKAGSAFYCGAPGVHALATVMHGKTDPSRAATHAHAVLSMLPAALRDPEVELLYGKAGYLYSLLVIQKHLPPALHPEGLETAMEQVFCSIVDECMVHGAELQKISPTKPIARSPLAVPFPARGGHHYLGAAHGLAGVLFVLLHLPKLCLQPKYKAVIVGSLTFLVQVQDPFGNFPSSVQSGRETEKRLVHWCHGAPGTIPTLCKAYEVYGDQVFLRSAELAGDCVWRRGLLRKGLGVCHGIAGSMLALLTLYRTTGVRRHLYRALRFCEACWSLDCLSVIAETADRQRECVGVPDHPYSLMEGMAGLLHAYISIARPDHSSFPGYDGAT
eukprot:m.330079 g.330079  ORF g.330079 m.330079 type:complete len:632 (+) comp19759_c1_seq17:161-2056(+)